LPTSIKKHKLECCICLLGCFFPLIGTTFIYGCQQVLDLA
jgi:hypothetical protein